MAEQSSRRRARPKTKKPASKPVSKPVSKPASKPASKPESPLPPSARPLSPLLSSQDVKASQQPTTPTTQPWYMAFDSGKYLLHVLLVLGVMSIITLRQTGEVATRGYAVAELEKQRVELLRKQDQLKVQYAMSQSLDRVRVRAEQLGLRPASHSQVRYMTITTTNLLDTMPLSPTIMPHSNAGRQP